MVVGGTRLKKKTKKKKKRKKKTNIIYIYIYMLTLVTSCRQKTKSKSKGWLKQFPCDVMLWYIGEKREEKKIFKSIAGSGTAVFRKEKKGNRERTMHVISI
jgi:hypothetical protein